MDDKENICRPTTKEEWEAFCRAVDEANEMVIENAIKRDQAQATEQPSEQ